jgi:hypothetical protein
MGLSYPVDKYQVGVSRILVVKTPYGLRKLDAIFPEFRREPLARLSHIFPIGGFRVRRLAGN